MCAPLTSLAGRECLGSNPGSPHLEMENEENLTIYEFVLTNFDERIENRRLVVPIFSPFGKLSEKHAVDIVLNCLGLLPRQVYEDLNKVKYDARREYGKDYPKWVLEDYSIINVGRSYVLPPQKVSLDDEVLRWVI